MNATDEIKRRIDIVDYISTYVRLTKRGKNWLGLCPFHSEKTPSFNVNRDPAIFKCFGCGEGGDIFKFVMKMEGLSFREALERLAEKAHVTLEERPGAAANADKKERIRAMHQEAARFYAERLWSTPDALEYAHKRGLADETLRNFGIGWAPDEWEALSRHLGKIGWTGRDLFEAGLVKANDRGGFYDAFRKRLMFPIFDVQNRVVAFGGRIVGEGDPKYLNSPESPIFFKSGTLYALNFANKPITEQDRVLVMEGYMDVVAAHQAGFPIAVATLGTSLTGDHVSVLARKTKHVILCYDADSAGIKAALRGGPMFEDAEVDVRLLTLPEGHDPDSYIKEFGAPAFAERMDRAIPLTEFQLTQLQYRFDMGTGEGRTAYVKEALPILATIRSNVTRDRYIRWLAELWAQGDMGRVAYREEDIRRDLAAQRRRWMAEQRAKWQSPRGEAPAPTLAEMERRSEPAPPETIAPPSGLAVKERVLLRAMLQEPNWVRPFGLHAGEFSEGLHRQMADLALAHLETGAEGSLLDDLSALPEALASFATELAMTADPPLTDAMVKENVVRMRAYARQRRIQELTAYIAGQERLDPTDPLLEEWRRLQQEPRYSDPIG